MDKIRKKLEDIISKMIKMAYAASLNMKKIRKTPRGKKKLCNIVIPTKIQQTKMWQQF